MVLACCYVLFVIESIVGMKELGKKEQTGYSCFPGGTREVGAARVENHFRCTTEMWYRRLPNGEASLQGFTNLLSPQALSSIIIIIFNLHNLNTITRSVTALIPSTHYKPGILCSVFSILHKASPSSCDKSSEQSHETFLIARGASRHPHL